jgi:hypothetical protein
MSASNLIPLPIREVPRSSPYDEFCAARRAMVAAFRRWLAAAPEGYQVTAEIDVTAAGMRQIFTAEGQN